MRLRLLFLLVILGLTSLLVTKSEAKKAKKPEKVAATYNFICKVLSFDAKDQLPSEMYCDYKENRMIWERKITKEAEKIITIPNQ
jgi:hypothetical protein